MLFMCLAYYDAEGFAKLAPAAVETIVKSCAPHDKALRDSGNLLLVGSLGMPDDARVIRPVGGEPTIAAGAYRTTGEPLGAFFMVEADSLEQATEVALLHPGAQLGRHFGGGIEVRPIDNLDVVRMPAAS